MELHQHRPAPPSPPTAPPISQKPPPEPDLKRRPILPISFSNGAVKKHRPILSPLQGIYRECMKNHAAAMGGHALDGCGEFMASPSSLPSDPSSLLCAACGCHRNFHRRVFPGDNLLHYHPHKEEREREPDEQDDEGDEAVDDDEDGHVTPPQQLYSAPHMLMALSAGISSSSTPGGHRKRFRTKFSAEQKEKMQELSEKLGWRMQKRDDAMVEQYCREIGVSRGVFKVWMHNNKHNFVGGPSSRRPAGAAGEMGTGAGGAAAAQIPSGLTSGGDPAMTTPSPSSEEP